MHRIKKIACLFLLLLLAGCKSQLYTGLGEREGNDMLALLLSSGIEATKELDKDNNMTLFVSNDSVARSIQLLRSNGFPRDKFSSISDVFPKDGLISSPTEERARYTYSMSQDLAATLSMIDGVVTARVHVVLPQESNGIQEQLHPSSAAVFIKYSSDLVLSGFISKVKTLIANSIEGLSLEKITVTLFPSSQVAALGNNSVKGAKLAHFLTIDVSPQSKGRLMVIVAGMGLFIILILIALGVLAWLLMRDKNNARASHLSTEEGDETIA